MEIPDLVRRKLGDEGIRTGISLGENDAVCFTPTRVLVYRGEGLLSDESITTLGLGVERLQVSHGRRKTTFSLTDIDGTESFSVPSDRAERVLEALLEGVLRVEGVIDTDESVRGVYRFSELTLIVADRRLVKLIGSAVWAEEYEVFEFADVTGLEYEDGSVATQIVLEVAGRPQRIKAPNDAAPKLRQTIQRALFAYYDVDSVGELNQTVGAAAENEAEREGPGSADLTLDSGIDPLVEETGPAAEDGATPADAERAGEPAPEPVEGVKTADPPDAAAGPPETAAVADELRRLAAAVERQNDMLDRQQRTLEQLIEELRHGR